MKTQAGPLSGKTVLGESGTCYTLGNRVGSGGQGVVYEVDSGDLMVKLCRPSGSESLDGETRKRLRHLQKLGLPRNFVAVRDVLQGPALGYVMDAVQGHKPLTTYLIPDRSQPFAQWYNQGLGLWERLFLGYLLAQSFRELEAHHLAYCDLSGSNLLVKVEEGASVRLIDVDNIYLPGWGRTPVLGTPRYIAPELLRGQRSPDVFSDNYSLAVLLFELLRVGHPYLSDAVLEGAPEDEEAALSGQGVYVKEGQDTCMLPESLVLTSRLRELFRRTFVEGKEHRLCRPSALEWEEALLEAGNQLTCCPHCHAWHYPRRQGRDWAPCPWCDQPSPPAAIVNIYEVVMAGESWQTGTPVRQKLCSTYVLKKDWTNLLKDVLFLRADDPLGEPRTKGNALTISREAGSFSVCNAFSKPGIWRKPYGSGNYLPLGDRQVQPLASGDELYAEGSLGRVEQRETGQTWYSLRMARFWEVTP